MKKTLTSPSPAAAQEWSDEKPESALSALARHRELAASLIYRDIRARYKQSILGIAWAVLTPLSMMLVYTVVFSRIVRVDTGDIPYPVFSYVALLPWTFFSQGLTAGAECLVNNFNLITKIYFPREVFPIAAILGKTVDLALGLVVLIPLLLFYRIDVSWTALLIVPILAVQLVLMLGVSLVLSSVNLFYRDIKHVIPLVLQIWMYATPIIYPLKMVPEQYRAVYMLNPMAIIMESYRRVALLGKMPDWAALGWVALGSVVVVVLGYRVFKRLEPAFAEVI